MKYFVIDLSVDMHSIDVVVFQQKNSNQYGCDFMDFVSWRIMNEVD